MSTERPPPSVIRRTGPGSRPWAGRSGLRSVPSPSAHLIGGSAILYANRGRAKHQSGVTANTLAKIVLTGAALGATVYSGLLGAKTARGDGHPVDGATEPSSGTPDDVAAAQKQLRYLQWALPVLTGAIVVLGAQQGEQQRAGQILAGVGSTLARRVTRSVAHDQCRCHDHPGTLVASCSSC